MDLAKGSTHDYVDNQYFSVQQIAVKLFALKNPVRIMDIDKGKVLLFVNMTLDEHQSAETKSMLNDMQRVLKKFNGDSGIKTPSATAASQFAVYAQFTTDVEGGEARLNKDIASELIKRGMLTQTLQPQSIRFLEKVSDYNSSLMHGLLQVDVNGLAMHDLYRVLKRQSDLFIKRYGMALHIKENHSKVRKF